jgi:hypothetical protein
MIHAYLQHSLFPPHLPLIQAQASLQSNRRHSIQHPSHFIRRHLCTLQTAHLTSLAQALQSESQFPTLCFVNEEDVFLAVGIADRGAEDVQVFGGLFARLGLLLVYKHTHRDIYRYRSCFGGGDIGGEGKNGKHTSTIFNVQALTSHSRCGIPLTSSSINRPSDCILRMSPSVTLPTLLTSWATGLGKRSLNR